MSSVNHDIYMCFRPCSGQDMDHTLRSTLENRARRQSARAFSKFSLVLAATWRSKWPLGLAPEVPHRSKRLPRLSPMPPEHSKCLLGLAPVASERSTWPFRLAPMPRVPWSQFSGLPWGRAGNGRSEQDSLLPSFL